jgi:hypothetical protein
MGARGRWGLMGKGFCETAKCAENIRNGVGCGEPVREREMMWEMGRIRGGDVGVLWVMGGERREKGVLCLMLDREEEGLGLSDVLRR